LYLCRERGAMAPVMAVPQRTPRRSTSHLVLVATAGVALAGKLLSGVVNSAFAGSTGAPVSRGYEGRKVEVYREVPRGLMPRFAKDAIKQDLKAMSDEDLKNVVMLSREYYFKHRMAVFAKRKPARAALHEMHYKLGLAKTLLRQRELEVEKRAMEDAEPEEPEVYRDWVARTFDHELASKTWTQRAGATNAKQFPTPRLLEDGTRSRNVPYYYKKGYTPPGPNGTATWEEGVRVRKSVPKKNRSRPWTFDIFRKGSAMPGMIPPSGVM